MTFAKYFLIGGLCFLLSIASQAASLSESVDSPIATGIAPFHTMDEAATAVLRRVVLTASTRLEFAGCIYKDHGQFLYTVPVSNGVEDEFKASCLAPASMELVAIYHTHPPGATLAGISSPDLAVAKKFNKTSYVAVLDSNEIVKFTPGVTKTQCAHESEFDCSTSQRYSRGDLVSALLNQ